MPNLPTKPQFPGGFGAMNGAAGNILGQANQALSAPGLQPVRDRVSSIMPQARAGAQSMFGGDRMPPNIQAMIQTLMSGGGSGSAPPQQPQRNFWNPNNGVQRPSIGNTPSTTTPFTPFAMPQNKAVSGGVPPPSPNYMGT